MSNQNPTLTLKPKREITKMTNSQNTKRTHGQPCEQPFPIRWSPRNPNRTKTTQTYIKRNVNETLTPKHATENLSSV